MGRRTQRSRPEISACEDTPSLPTRPHPTLTFQLRVPDPGTSVVGSLLRAQVAWGRCQAGTAEEMKVEERLGCVRGGALGELTHGIRRVG